MVRTRLILMAFMLLAVSSAPNAEERVLKIVAILPLTGGAAEQGEWVRQGIELALEEEPVSGLTVDVRFEDSQGDPKLAVSAYQSALNRFSPTAVLSWGSGVGLALTPLVNRDKVVQLGVATASAQYRTPDDFTFRNFPSTTNEAVFSSHAFLSTLTASSVAILKINNDNGLSTAASFSKEFTSHGGRIVFEEVLEPHETDFRGIVTRLKQSDAEGIFLASYPTEGAIVLKQMRALGISLPVIGSAASIGSKDFFKLAGNGVSNFYVVSSHCDFLTKRSAVTQRFVERYAKKFSVTPELPQAFAARSFDAVRLLVAAASGCEVVDGSCVRSGLIGLKPLEGAGAKVSFDSFGDIDTTFNLFEVKNGSFVAR